MPRSARARQVTRCWPASEPLRTARQPSCPSGHSDFPEPVVVTLAGAFPSVPEELSGAMNRPMIVPCRLRPRPQQRYDHRLRNLVQRTGDVTVATDLGVPSLDRAWLA